MTGLTKPKDRSAKSKAALLEAGGRKLNVNLGPEATAALAKIKASGDYKTDKAAVVDTLVRRASRIPK
jgi:hypothetical protein